VPPGLSLELACGGTVSTAIIDYADDPSGPLDIVGATRAMRGVRPTDIVAIDGTSTVVVRDGRVIWRGSWSPGASGFYLGGYSACEEGRGIGIGG
jgi:hypothetical protein